MSVLKKGDIIKYKHDGWENAGIWIVTGPVIHYDRWSHLRVSIEKLLNKSGTKPKRTLTRTTWCDDLEKPHPVVLKRIETQLENIKQEAQKDEDNAFIIF